MSDHPYETFTLDLARHMPAVPGAVGTALDAFFAALPPRGRWSTAQARARHALAAWLDDEAARRCILFGPAGTGKTLLGVAMAEDAKRASFSAAFIPVGRATGLALSAQVLGLLAAMLKDNEEPPAPTDPKRLRWATWLAILNGRDEDEAPWLIVLDGVDELVLTPVEPNFDAAKDIGSRTHVLASVTGGRDEAHAWCGRLGWKVEETTFVTLEGLTTEEAKAIGVSPLTRFASEAESAEALVMSVLEALRGLLRGAEVRWAVTTLARLLGPVSSFSLDLLAGFGASDAIQQKAARERLAPILRWMPGEAGLITFAHEALRAAWERQTASEDEHVQARILTRIVIFRDFSFPLGMCEYVLSYGSAHVALAGADAAELVRFVEPRWTRATSPERASQIFVDLRLARRVLNKAFQDTISEETTGPGAAWALGEMARCALARAANEAHVAEERWAEEPLLADDKARAELAAAQAEALYGLAQIASADLHTTLLAEAIERASIIGSAGPVTPRLVDIATEAARKGKLELARAALDRLVRLDDEGAAVLHLVLPLAALLPGKETDRWIRKALTRTRRKRRPPEARMSLVPPGGLAEEIASALRRAAAAKAPEDSVDLMARLIPWLPVEERKAALTEVLSAYERSMADPDAPIVLDYATRAMLTPYLSEEETRARLIDAPLWPASALAERLASMGYIGETRALIDRWLEGPTYREPALLRVAAVAPPEARPALVAELKERMAALDEEQRARLVCDQPGAAVLVLGPEEALAAASGCTSFVYGALVAIAAVTPHLPEVRRPEVTRLLMKLYRQEPDSDALPEVVSLAHWMTRADAAWLVSESLGEVGSRQTMANVLSGWGSIAQLAPVIARAAGDPALEAAAQQVREVVRWV